MFVFRLLIGFALAASLSNHHRTTSSEHELLGALTATKARRAADRPNTDLGEFARGYYERGKYREAIQVYTLWKPWSFCGNASAWMRDERQHRIALCHSHLGDHAAAVRVLLDATAENTLGEDGAAKYLIQLYREAEQLNDLGALLDHIEQRLLSRDHPELRLMTPQQRTEEIALTRARVVRYHLRAEKLAQLPPWPVTVPKPKPGSLPETIPK